MKLPAPSSKYMPFIEMERNRQIEQADRVNHKRDRDLEIGQTRLILTASDGSRWALQVSAAGALSAVAI